MSERESLTVVLPVLVQRRLGDKGSASGCGDRCPYLTPLFRGHSTVQHCFLFRQDIESGNRLPDCISAGNASGDDPHAFIPKESA